MLRLVGPTASFVKSTLIPSTTALLTRQKTALRKPRTEHWNTKKGGNHWALSKKASLADGYDQINKHLTKKRSVTSLEGALALEKISSMIKRLELDNQGQPDQVPWKDWKRLRPGHSKHSHYQFRVHRRSCFVAKQKKYVRSSCSVCSIGWYPMYYEPEKLKTYIDPKSNQVLSEKITNLKVEDTYHLPTSQVSRNRPKQVNNNQNSLFRSGLVINQSGTTIS
eukprot:sb/3469739/